MWISDFKKIHRVNPADGGVLLSFDARNYAGLEHDGSNLWGWELYGDIYKIDPSTGEILASFPAPESSWPYDLAFDGAHLWAVDRLHDKIYKLDPANCEVLDSFDSPADDPMGLAFDGTHLWISVTSPDDYIFKMNRPASSD
ncbi:MAG: glutaminyl-peptide cyclotransferase [Desulfobacterales bacterium]|nr:glutaminyl-peptide cyclotransferase [Desulfobacterales bacterium]